MKYGSKTSSRVFLRAAIIVLLLMVGCGSSVPSEMNARTVLENQMKSDIQDGTVRIFSFKKVNGQLLDIDGIKVYNLEYEMKIEFPKGIYAFGRQIRGKGEIAVKKGEIEFEETEKGWRGPDGNIY